MLNELRERTGAISAAEVFLTPVSGAGWDGMAWADGASDAHKLALFNQAGPNYFHTMGTSIVAGRDFDERDNLKAPKVAIVNEEFAKTFFNGQSPVGRAFRQEGGREGRTTYTRLSGWCGTRSTTNCGRTSGP